MPAKLKVFRTAAGFHDVYVAAPSQKAALAAWGAEANLFARGMAEQVTDPALTKAPLADPGVVIRRARGNEAEHLAGLAVSPAPHRSKRVSSPIDRADVKKAERREVASPRLSSTPKPPSSTPKPLPKPRPPRPDRAAVGAAEEALAKARKLFEAELAELDKEAAAIARQRARLAAAHGREEQRLIAQRDTAQTRYEAALARWRSG